MRFRLLYIYILIWGLFGGNIFSVFGQTISGQILDEAKRPVPYATVVLSLDSISKEILQHTVSSEQGRFKFENIVLDRDYSTLWLTIRSVGYRKLTKSVSSKQAENLYLQLIEDETQLPEMVVKGISPDMYTRGDTVVFRSLNYRIGHEKSLGDVVARMPGIEISAQGNVTFQGKPINKLLVNGADLLSNSVSNNLNTFSSDFADEVEVITDYDDGSIDKALRGNRDVALNLKTSKSLRINGWIDLAGGLKRKYNTQSSLISVLDRISILTNFNANNNGERWIRWGDYKNVYTSSNSFGGRGTRTIIYSADEAEMLNPSVDMYKRNGGAGTADFIWMPNPKYRMTFSNVLHGSSSSKYFSQKQSYPHKGLDPLINQQSSFQNRVLSFFAHQLEQRWIPSRSFSLETTTRIEYTKGDVKDQIENLIPSMSDLPQIITEDNKRGYDNISNKIEIKCVVGNGLLFIGNKFYLTRSDNASDLHGNMPLFLDTEYDSNQNVSYELHTQINGRRFKTETYIGGTVPITSNQILRGELRYNTNDNKRDILQKNRLQDEDHLADEVFSGYLSLMKNEGSFIYNLGLEAGWHSLRHQSLNTERSKTPFFLAPQIEIGFRPSNLHRLLLTMTYDTYSYSIVDLSQIGYRESYRGVRKASQVNNPFSKKWNNILEYSYSDLRRKLFVNASVHYSLYFNRPMMDFSMSGINYILGVEDGGRQGRFSADADGSLSFSRLPLDLKMSLSYGRSSMDFLLNNEGETLLDQSISSNFGVQTRFRTSPLNTLINLSLRKMGQKYQYQNISSQQYLVGISGALFGHLNKFSFQMSATHQWLNDQKRRWTFLDLAMSLRYTSQKIIIEVVGKDLLHLTKNEWIMHDATLEYIATTMYRQMPGCLMLSFRYSF